MGTHKNNALGKQFKGKILKPLLSTFTLVYFERTLLSPKQEIEKPGTKLPKYDFYLSQFRNYYSDYRVYVIFAC